MCGNDGTDCEELTMNLTQPQVDLLKFIAQCIDQTGCQPSYRDICRQMGYASPNTVAGHMNALVRKGLIKKRGARAIEFDWRLFAGAR